MRVKKRVGTFFMMLVLFLLASCFDRSKYEPKPYVRPLELVKISDKEYIHISYLKDSFGGYTPNNGFIRIEGNEAVVFDTPINDSISKQLITYIENDLKSRIVALVLSDYKEDAAGGVMAFSKAQIPSYAAMYTAQMLKDSIKITHSIEDTYSFKLAHLRIRCHYLGAAHSEGALFSYIERDSTLFAGSAIKPLFSQDDTHLEDKNYKQWALALHEVKKTYPNVQKVVLRQGAIGDRSLIDHTINLLDPYALEQLPTEQEILAD